MIKRHYEKVIIACGFLFIFVNLGVASTAFSVHQPYLVAMEGIGDTGGSLILSVRTLTAFIAMFFVDRYYQLLDVRLGVLVACLCTAGGDIAYSMATSLPVFFVGAMLSGLGYGLGGAVALTYLTNRWFATGVGSAVGFAAMGSGIASILVPLVVVRVIEAYSLSTAFVVEGCAAAVIGLVVFAFLRNRPEDVGLEPYRGKAGKDRSRAELDVASASRIERGSLLGAMMLVGVFCCCGITYLSVLATSSGFDAVFAATLVAAAGAALTVAKFIAGELFDYLGAPRASAIQFATGAVGFALCCFAGTGNAAVLVCGAVAVGAGLSLGTVGISVWSLDSARPERRARDVKNFQMAYALGGFIANTLPGIVKDLVGTYVVTYAAMVVVIVVAAIVILRFYRAHACES